MPQEEIALAAECGQATISEVLSEKFLGTEAIKPVANHLTDFDTPIYNIWKQQTTVEQLWKQAASDGFIYNFVGNL
jgi:hypothetical protein